MSAPALQVISSTDRRGAEVFAVELAAALETTGRDVTTLALVAGRSRDGLQVPVLGTRSLSIATLRALRRRARDARTVISHGSRTLPACAIAGLGTRQAFVYRSIGDVVSYASTRARQGRVSLYLRRASAVVALWPDGAQLIHRRYRVPESKIWTIPNGVPARRFPVVDADRRSAARSRAGLVSDGPVALYLGSLIPEKGVDYAIRAVARVPDLTLVIAGDGPERPHLEALARDLPSGRVRFIGMIADAAEALALADVLVLPSLTEGMPAVAIEAGMSGLPVVASDVGAVREVVLDGRTGAVVPSRDSSSLARALEEVLKAPVELGRDARAHCIARFEIGVVAAAWESLLQTVEHQ